MSLLMTDHDWSDRKDERNKANWFVLKLQDTLNGLWALANTQCPELQEMTLKDIRTLQGMRDTYCYGYEVDTLFLDKT